MFYASDSFKALLQVPELSTIGTVEERAAFTALRIDGRTVREAAEVVGVSKSHVTNLANQFQVKLIRKMSELRRKPASARSAEYRAASHALYERLCELREFECDEGLFKIGNFTPGLGSREDWAECTGQPLKFEDD